MGARRRIATVATTGFCLCSSFFAVTASTALAACDPSANPASDFPTAGLQWGNGQAIQTNFTNARAAEGCATPLVLPAGYDAMTPQQQMLSLFNSERQARGEPDLQLDRTLISQVALNHSQEMVQYNYFAHTSPINQLGVGTPGVDVPRQRVNPVFATNYFFGENQAKGFATPAEATFAYMYVDSAQGWGHRGAILQAGFQWTGIGIAPLPNGGAVYTDDFEAYVGFVPPGGSPPVYTPPATADTNPPSIASVGYANGTATATGVADSPLNVNDTGPNPTTAGITGVVFYVNNIVDGNMQGTAWNTVAGTQTAPGSGTWTANITVNPGDVLHAVAVDGSGNYADLTSAPPAMTLGAGANTVALPAAGATPAMATRAAVGGLATNPARAATPSASALVASIDHQLGKHAVRDVKVYISGHWHVYRPGRSADFPLYLGEGVVVDLTTGGHWRIPAHRQIFRAPTLHLRAGWNFVSVPFPETGMTCHAVRLEVGALGSTLEQITVGPSQTVGVIMKPHHGSWGNDILAKLPYQKGFWIKVKHALTWTPSPTGYLGIGQKRIR